MKASRTAKSIKSPSKKPAVEKKKVVATKRTSASIKTKPAGTTAASRQEITTDTIARHAYTLWEKDGRPHGRDMEYWLKAENELKQDSQSFAA